VNERFALITGASLGIGRALAEELASRHYNLLLVALPESGLPDYARSIAKKYHVKAICLETDLCREDAVQQVADWAKNQKGNLQILINNAGFGHAGSFLGQDTAFYEKMIRLNAVVPVMLTHHLLPLLLKNEQSYLLNVSSMAGMRPSPFKTVYGATKSLLLNFSHSLRGELKGRGLNISVLCPGAVLTNQEVQERIERAGRLAMAAALTPEKVARFAIKKLFKGKAVIVPGRFNRYLNRLGMFIPNFLQQKAIRKVFLKSSP